MQITHLGTVTNILQDKNDIELMGSLLATLFRAWLDYFMPLKLGVTEVWTLGVLLYI